MYHTANALAGRGAVLGARSRHLDALPPSALRARLESGSQADRAGAGGRRERQQLDARWCHHPQPRRPLPAHHRPPAATRTTVDERSQPHAPGAPRRAVPRGPATTRRSAAARRSGPADRTRDRRAARLDTCTPRWAPTTRCLVPRWPRRTSTCLPPWRTGCGGGGGDDRSAGPRHRQRGRPPRPDRPGYAGTGRVRRTAWESD